MKGAKHVTFIVGCITAWFSQCYERVEQSDEGPKCREVIPFLEMYL
jgi:hypothetical protein